MKIFLIIVSINYAIALSTIIPTVTGWSILTSSSKITRTATTSRTYGDRRDFTASTLATLLATFGLAGNSRPATAFDNKISNKYDDRPKRRGPKPKDLGVSIRTRLDGIDEYIGLKQCGYAPNCFSSTMVDDTDHAIPPFVWPSNLNSSEQAFLQLRDTLQAYPPGQDGVDGGGFQIQTFDGQKGYIYTQFQSLKNGYIDDVEFASIGTAPGDDHTVHVRSSSRIGYLDYGVNAKRINWIAKSLREKGWTAEGVDLSSHRRYAIENELQ